MSRSFEGFGAGSGFTFQVQDKGGHTQAEIFKVTSNFLAALNKRKEIQNTNTDRTLGLYFGASNGFLQIYGTQIAK